jgi:hypothetical protein
VAVVSHLVGLPDEGREHMLDRAAATFDALGPKNARMQDAGPTLIEMIQYAVGVEQGNLPSHGWAARLFDAVDEGALDAGDARGLLIDYIARASTRRSWGPAICSTSSGHIPTNTSCCARAQS